jgi:hypothetical protein
VCVCVCVCVCVLFVLFLCRTLIQSINTQQKYSCSPPPVFPSFPSLSFPPPSFPSLLSLPLSSIPASLQSPSYGLSSVVFQ